jgi:hypothetical protein
VINSVLLFHIDDYEQTDTLRLAVRSILTMNPTVTKLLENCTVNTHVVVKPNWVQPDNHNPKGSWQELITHPAVIEAVVDELASLMHGIGYITICDSPHTSADFSNLLRLGNFAERINKLRNKYSQIVLQIVDLRREVWVEKEEVTVSRKQQKGDPQGYVAINLGYDSLFFGHCGQGHYHGANYDAGIVNSHHHGEIQEYLISKTPLQCDLFVNVPKLKLMIPIGINKNSIPDIPFLLYGTWLLFILGLICLIVQGIQPKFFSETIRNFLFCPSILFFYVAAFVLYFVLQFYELRFWDEFSFWGIIAKETYYYNAIYGGTETIVPQLSSYVPGMTLLHYYVCTILGFSEGVLYYMTLLLLLSCTICFTFGGNGKPWLILLILLFVSFQFTFLFFHVGNEPNGPISIYVDNLLAVLFSSVLFIYVSQSYKRVPFFQKILPLYPGLAALVLTKKMGSLFCAIVLMIIVVDIVIDVVLSKKISYTFTGFTYRTFKISHSTLIKTIALGFLLLTPIFVLKTWDFRVSLIGHSQSMSSNTLLKDSLKLFNNTKKEVPLYYWPLAVTNFDVYQRVSTAAKNSLTSHQITSITNGKKAFLHRGLWFTPSFQMNLMAPWTWFKLSCILGFILFCSKSLINFRIRFLSSVLLLLLGFVTYCCFMQCSYIFMFSNNESVRLASYERYIGTYACGGSLYLIGMACLCFRKNSMQKSSASWTMLIVFLTIIIVCCPPIKHYQKYFFATSSPTRNELRSIVQKVIPQLNDIKKVWIIYQHSNGFHHRIVGYELSPQVHFQRWSWSLGKPYYKGDVWTTDWTPQQWMNELLTFDAVLLCHTDDQFWSTYGELFEGERNNHCSLYRVVTEPLGSVKLVPIQ